MAGMSGGRKEPGHGHNRPDPLGVDVSTGQVPIRPGHLASTWRPALWWRHASRRWTGLAPTLATVLP